MIFIKLDLAGLLLIPSGKLRLSGMGDKGYFSVSSKSMTWPILIAWRKRSPKTSLLTSAVVRLVFFLIYFFFTIVDLLMFQGMGSKNFLENSRSRSWRNSSAIVMLSFCRFTSLVAVSISDPELYQHGLSTWSCLEQYQMGWRTHSPQRNSVARGLSRVRSKNFFPETIIIKVFETNSSFHSK